MPALPACVLVYSARHGEMVRCCNEAKLSAASFATQSAVMSPWVGPIPPVVKTLGAATQQRIECVDDRSLLIADDL
jgi:hypothetical protein